MNEGKVLEKKKVKDARDVRFGRGKTPSTSLPDCPETMRQQFLLWSSILTSTVKQDRSFQSNNELLNSGGNLQPQGNTPLRHIPHSCAVPKPLQRPPTYGCVGRLKDYSCPNPTVSSTAMVSL